MNKYSRLKSVCIRNADSEREGQDFPDEYRMTKSDRNHYNGSRKWRK